MIRTNLTEILKRPLTLSTDAKAWKLVASAAAILLSAAAILTSAQGQTQYPPVTEYLMPQDAEIALARSAAPANVSDQATIKVLNESGFQLLFPMLNAVSITIFHKLMRIFYFS